MTKGRGDVKGKGRCEGEENELRGDGEGKSKKDVRKGLVEKRKLSALLKKLNQPSLALLIEVQTKWKRMLIE